MKTVKAKKITRKEKSPACTGYSIKYHKDLPIHITLSSEQGFVSVDRETMLQIMHDWEDSSDGDSLLPQKYIFNVEAER